MTNLLRMGVMDTSGEVALGAMGTVTRVSGDVALEAIMAQSAMTSV